jgi:hypothetical protein
MRAFPGSCLQFKKQARAHIVHRKLPAGAEFRATLASSTIAMQAELAGAATSAREGVEGQLTPTEWEAWDSKRSLFDNHLSASFEQNLEYMYKTFGFHFPEWEYLQDPQGLLQYALPAQTVVLTTRGIRSRCAGIRDGH